MNPMMLTRRGLLLSAAALAACSPDQPSFSGIDITGADYAQGFDLPDHNGQRRTLADFKGKVVVVFFGFTQCPDVCPTSMAELAQVKQQLGADGDKLQGIFITVDPERDTAELLKALSALEAQAEKVSVPLSYADELYALRNHIHLVRKKLIRASEGGEPRPLQEAAPP